METDITRPTKLYRYSERAWLEKSLNLGEFRIRPASDYKALEMDAARRDDELVRMDKSPPEQVIITMASDGQRILPLGDVVYRSEVGSDYFSLCFSDRWDPILFDEFPGTDSCLVIHDVKTFSESIYTAVEKVLPNWGGIDGPIVYGGRGPLGAAFAKPLPFAVQHEWRFAWRPWVPTWELFPFKIALGDLSGMAEIIDK